MIDCGRWTDTLKQSSARTSQILPSTSLLLFVYSAIARSPLILYISISSILNHSFSVHFGFLRCTSISKTHIGEYVSKTLRHKGCCQINKNLFDTAETICIQFSAFQQCYEAFIVLGAVHILRQPKTGVPTPPLPPLSAMVSIWLTPPSSLRQLSSAFARRYMALL